MGREELRQALALVLPVVGGAAVGFWQSTPRGAVALTIN
jgi:hypothetical protein